MSNEDTSKRWASGCHVLVPVRIDVGLHLAVGVGLDVVDSEGNSLVGEEACVGEAFDVVVLVATLDREASPVGASPQGSQIKAFFARHLSVEA